MKRVALTDGSGQWFDEDRAQSEWRSVGNWRDFKVLREILYLTAGGKWVLEFVPIFDRDVTTHSIVNTKEAAMWLIANDHDLPDALVAEAQTMEI